MAGYHKGVLVRGGAGREGRRGGGRDSSVLTCGRGLGEERTDGWDMGPERESGRERVTGQTN